MASKADEMYPPGKGLVVCFNMSMFGKKKENEYVEDARYRFGAEQDVAMVSLMANSLDVDYMFKDNLTSEEVKKCINEEIAAKIGYAYLFTIFNTHGEEGDNILAADNKILHTYNDIIVPLHHTPSFLGKPKLYFFNACRGDQKPQTAIKRSTTDSESSYFEAEEIWQPSADGRVGKVVKTGNKYEVHKSIGDYCSIFSTTPYTVSWRDTKKGSSAIQCMTETFAELLNTQKEILFMDFMRKFNSKMKQQFDQQPEIRYLFVKDFYIRTKTGEPAK